MTGAPDALPEAMRYEALPTPIGRAAKPKMMHATTVPIGTPRWRRNARSIGFSFNRESVLRFTVDSSAWTTSAGAPA